ncbi:MAG TPA: DUF885 domain-containing protein [Candidatus Baltobacteraceae bacterium]
MTYLRSMAVLSLAALLGAGPMAPMPAMSAEDRYAALAKQYFAQSFAANPISATESGLHAYDAQLGDFSAAHFRAQLATDAAYLARLRAIDTSALSPEVKIDAKLLEYSLRDDLLLNGTMAQWKHSPDDYTGAASGAIFSIMSRNYAPLSARANDAIARELQIPAMLRAARANITTVDATTKSIAADDARGSVSFFTDTVPQGFAALTDPALKKRLAAANAGAAAAMKSYAAWIATIRPSGTYAIGADAYRQRLLYEDGLNMSVADYLAVGEKALDATHAQFVATAKKINPKASPLAVYLSIAKIGPAPGDLVAVAQKGLLQLRSFIIAKHIVALPLGMNVKAIETPQFERTTTTAAEDSPGPLETVATQTYYYVTPVDPTWNAQQTKDYLAQFNNFEFPIISAHEVYPGHATNFAIARTLHLSLTRKLSQSSEYAEGWAHYSEQMMVDEGWGNGDPRVRLAQLEEAMLRNCRYVVGVGLHTGGMTIAQAEDTFVNRCFQPRQVAVEETLRGTQDPMYGYYTLGKLMILKLRADYTRKMGAAYTLEKFHDAFLAHGDPPIPLLRPILLGSSDDGEPL